jgi:hypothetical protein
VNVREIGMQIRSMCCQILELNMHQSFELFSHRTLNALTVVSDELLYQYLVIVFIFDYGLRPPPANISYGRTTFLLPFTVALLDIFAEPNLQRELSLVLGVLLRAQLAGQHFIMGQGKPTEHVQRIYIAWHLELIRYISCDGLSKFPLSIVLQIFRDIVY